MARNFLDDLRRIVLEQQTRIDSPVANIHGAARAPVAALVSAVHSRWLALELPGTYATVDAFYTAVQTQSGTPTRTALETDNGIVTVTSAAKEAGTFLIRGTVHLDQGRSIPIAVDGGSFQLVVDGRMVRTGQSGSELRISLDQGDHSIDVLCTSRVCGLAVPADLLVDHTREVLAAPTWKGVTTGYRDTNSGATYVGLEWLVDRRVGGWAVFRRTQSALSSITSIGTPDTSGAVTLSLTGNQAANLTLGADLYAGNTLVGSILEAVFTGTDTAVRVRLPLGTTKASSQWVGRTASTSSLRQLTTIARTALGGTQTWNDTDVAYGEYYEYALQAYGLFDPESVSDLSPIQVVRAGDTQPPGPIVMKAAYPRVVDTMARVKFHTPTDADYAGVRVYYRVSATGTATGGSASTLAGTFTNGATNAYAGYTVRITAGTNAGQQRAVTASSTSSLTVDTPWLATPDATSVWLVFKDTALCTDYGLPDTDDQLTFEPVGTAITAPVQQYQFRTFDLVGHEQSDYDAVLWSYDPANNALSGAPYDNVNIDIVPAGTNATQVQVSVTATNPQGNPQVKLVLLQGSTSVLACSAAGGGTLGTLVPSGTTWTFARPAPLTQPAEAGFQSYLAGAVQDADQFTIAEQGRDTVTLICKAKVLSSTAVSTVVAVTVNDPLNASAVMTLTIDDLGGLSAITPATVTNTGTFTQNFTVPRPAFGSGVARVVWKVTAAGRTEDYDSVDVVPQDRDTRYTNCNPKIVSSDATTVTVQVDAVANTGTPTVALVATTGSASALSCTVAGGLTPLTFVPSGTRWVFTRGAINAGAGQAQFRATLSGYEDDDGFIPVEEQGRDTVILGIKARVTATYADRVDVRVYVIDPYPQGTNTVTVSYESQGTGAITAPGVLTLTPTAAYGTTGYVDFTVYRPNFSVGAGHFIVSASAANRETAVDSVVVPEAMQDTRSCTCQARITSVTTTQITVTVTAPSVGGVAPQVQYVGVTGSATLASGATAGTYGVQNGTANVWVFNRGAFQSGLGQAQFRAHLASTTTYPAIDDDDFVELADQGRDTVGLILQCSSIGSTATTETIRVAVLDPYPQGANTATVSWAGSGTGGVTPASATVTPAATFTGAAGTYADFAVTRPLFGSPAATVVFTATAANRIPDVDSIVVQPVIQTTFGPSLDVKAVPGTSTYTLYYTYTGTITLTIGNGTPATPSASGFSVSRGASDLSYTFTCVKDSQTITDTVIIPALGVDTVTPDLTVNAGATQSATQTSYVVTAVNPKAGGAAPTITVTPQNTTAYWNSGTYTSGTPFTPATGDTVVVDRPVFSAAVATVVVRAAIASNGAETVSRSVPNRERDTQYCECKTSVYSSDANTVVVQVDAVSPNGTPNVALVATTGSATATACSGGASGLTPLTYMAAGTRWTFTRGAFQAGQGAAQFRASLAGLQSDDDSIDIPEKGRDTVALQLTVTVLSATANYVRVRCTATDPVPQGAGTLVITPASVGLANLYNASTTTAATAVALASGQYADYDCYRAAVGNGPGRATFTLTTNSAPRTADSDSIDVDAFQPDTKAITVKVQQTSTGTTTPLVYNVIVTDPAGGAVNLTVDAAGNTLTSSSLSVLTPTNALSTGGASPMTVQIEVAQPVFGQSPAHVRLRGYTSGGTSTDGLATLVIPAVDRDTVALQVTAVVLSTTVNYVRVRCTVTDPVPQGAGTLVLTPSSVGLANLYVAGTTTAATATTLSSGGTADFDCYRAAVGNSAGRATFTLTSNSAARTVDSDSVDVPAFQPDTKAVTTAVQLIGRTSTTSTYYVTVTDPAGQNVALDVAAAACTVTSVPNGFNSPVSNISFSSGPSGTTRQVDVQHPTFGLGVGNVLFRGYSVAGVSLESYAAITVPGVDRDTVTIQGKLVAVTMTDTLLTVELRLLDPLAVATSIAFYLNSIGCTWDASGAGLVGPLTNGSNGGPHNTALYIYIDRPAWNQPSGRLDVRITSPGRADGFAHVDVPPRTSAAVAGKRLFLPGSYVLPDSPSAVFLRSTNSMETSNVSTTGFNGFIPFTLPDGVTVTSWESITKRADASGTATVTFYRTLRGAVGSTILATHTNSTTGSGQLITTSVSEVIDNATYDYSAGVGLVCGLGNVAYPSDFLGIGIVYTSPNLSKTI